MIKIIKKQPEESEEIKEIPYKPYNPTLLRNTEYLSLAEQYAREQDQQWLAEEQQRLK